MSLSLSRQNWYSLHHRSLSDRHQHPHHISEALPPSAISGKITAMAYSICASASPTSNIYKIKPQFKHSLSLFSLSLSISFPNSHRTLQVACCAAKQKNRPVKKVANKKRKQKSSSGNRSDALKGLSLDDVEFEEDEYRNGGAVDESSKSTARSSQSYEPLAMPKPPAGFMVDEQGRVLMASNKRLATIFDSTSNCPLECIIRRVFKSSRGDDCVLLCPADMPVLVLKSLNFEGWSAVSDDEVDSLLPTVAYALAKVHMHFIHSGFCYTARGGFCYTEDDIFEFRTDDDIDGVSTEGIEITCFHMDGSHYMIYTPSDPLLFVAVKDHNGQWKIADDDILEDAATVSAVDEEIEFNALVEEEAALLDSLLGRDID